ncbi:hypothetical protein [Salinigranum sp.]|jgi:hypothetical protein|uniref:hypothetical protein n=1 Tax=Salinigranum sp. TaxID=1966351 RepID=UPI0035668918
MVTLVDFLARLIGSVFELVVIFITRVALSDPLAFVSFLIGGALTTFAIAALGYLALGALVDAVGGGLGGGGDSGAIGRAPQRRE